VAEWAELFADVLLLGSYEIVRRDGARIDLTIHEGVILGVLAQARGEWKAGQTLAAAIYGDHGEWAKSWVNVVAQHMHRVRDKIEGCSFGIEADQHRRNLGYRLTGHLRVER
jgi:DNA-binding response OmpR family regulator